MSSKRITYKGVVGVTENQVEFAKQIMEGKNQTEAVKAINPTAKKPGQYGRELMANPKVKRLIRRMLTYGKVDENSEICETVLERILADPESKPTNIFKAAIYLHESFGYGKTSNSEWKYDAKKKEASERAFKLIKGVAENPDAAPSVAQRAAQYLHEGFGEAADQAEKPNVVDIDSLEGTDLDEYIEDLEKQLADHPEEKEEGFDIDVVFPRKELKNKH